MIYLLIVINSCENCDLDPMLVAISDLQVDLHQTCPFLGFQHVEHM